MEIEPQVAQKKITRQRASLSCQVCRKRKIKCDKVRPTCGSCSKNGDLCAYDAALSPALHTANGNGTINPPLDHDDVTVSDEAVPKRRRGLESHDVASYAVLADSGSAEFPKGGPTSTPLSKREGPVDLEAKLDRLTSMVERALKKSPRNSRGTRKKVGKSNSSRSNIKRVHPSKLSLSHLSDYNDTELPKSGHSLELSDQEDNSLSSRSNSISDEIGTVNDLSRGHLSITDGGRSRYVGGTYWASVVDEVVELSRLLREAAVFQPINSNLKSRICNIDHLSATEPTSNGLKYDDRQCSSPLMNQPYPEPEVIDKSILFQAMESTEPAHFAVLHEGLLEDLPSKSQCRCFVSGVHSNAPLAYLPTILHWYEDFWSWHEHRATTKIPIPNPSFIPLLYAILYGGAVSCSAEIVSKEIGDKLSVTSRLHNRVTQSLSMLSFVESPSIPGLIAFCIVQTIPLREEEPLRARIFVNLAVQAAVSMGLHREPSKFGLTPGDAETRRRLWWHIVWIDILASNFTGWPLLVMADSYLDVENVSELRHILIGTKTGEKYLDAVRNGNQKPEIPDNPFRDVRSHVSLPLVIAQGRYVAAGYLRKIIRIQLGVKPIGSKECQLLRKLLLDYEGEIEERIARIPQLDASTVAGSKNSDDKVGDSPRTPIKHYKGMIPEADIHSHISYHRSTWVAYHKWAKCLLEVMIHKVHCVVSQIYIKNTKLWEEMRESILGHCHAFMRGYFAINLNPDFEPFTWGWPGTHQPLHAMTLMLIDLYRKPFSPEATLSRFYVDQCFLLSEPNKGLFPQDELPALRLKCEGGKQAFNFLRQLRSRTWRVAGLDPDVLWVEDPDKQDEESRQDKRKEYSNAMCNQHPLTTIGKEQSPTSTELNTEQVQPALSANIFNNTTDFRQPGREVVHLGTSSHLPTDLFPEARYAMPNTSAPIIAADDLAVPIALGDLSPSQDLDWNEWESIFGQYAPIDEEAMDLNMWRL